MPLLAHVQINAKNRRLFNNSHAKLKSMDPTKMELLRQLQTTVEVKFEFYIKCHVMYFSSTVERLKTN